MLLNKERSSSPTAFKTSLKNGSLSSSVSSASSASSSLKQSSPSQFPSMKSSFQPTSFSYHTFNPNRVSSYDNENFYESSNAFWSKQDTLSEKSDEQFDNVNYCRKRASIACTNSTTKPKASLLSRALTYSSKTGSNSSLSKNFSWRAKLGKYLSSNSSKIKKPDEDIYSSYHLTRKNAIQIPAANSNMNILVSSSSSSSSSSQMSPSPKAKHLTSSLQKLSITNGFNSLRKMLRIKSSSKQNFDSNLESQTLNRPRKGSKNLKKQFSFNQNDSILNLFGSKQDEIVLNSTRNDSSCFNTNLKQLNCVRKECNCVDTSGSTLFNNILSSSPITIRNFDQPEVEAVPEAISGSNVKMYDGYRSLIKQIEELKLSREEADQVNEEDLKCDMEVASFFARTIKCQPVNNYFSTNDLVNYDYMESVIEPNEEHNLDFLVKQLVAEASLSDINFENKINSSAEHNYENMAYEEKNSLDLSEYVDMCDLQSSSTESISDDFVAKNRHLPTFSNSLGHVTKRMEYFRPANNHANNSIKIEKKIRLNYRRPQNGYVANDNYFNFGTLC